MIRLIIFSLVVFFSTPCFGLSPAISHTASVGNQCVSCSGTARVLWEATSTTVGDGSCECSDDDTSLAANGQATISSGIASYDDTGADGLDYHSMDADSGDDDARTTFVRFRINTWDTASRIWSILVDATDKTFVDMYGTDELRGYWEGNDVPDDVLTTDANLSTGVWYIVRYRYEVGRGTYDHGIAVFTSAGAAQGTAVNELDSITAFDNQPTTDDRHFGNDSTAAGMDIDIDYVHEYDEWRDDDPQADID